MTDFAPYSSPSLRCQWRRILSGVGCCLGGLALAVLTSGSAVAAAYPVSGNQLFTYADGLVAGSGAWNDGTTLSSTTMGDPPVPVASVQGGALRLTADGVLNAVSSFKIPELDPGSDISALTINFTLKLKHAGTPGGGFTVAFGDIPAGDGDGDLGFALPKGLEIAWETDIDPAPGGSQGQIVVYANRVKLVSYPQTFASDDTFRNVTIQWGSAGLSLSWNGVSLGTAIPVPGFLPAVGDRAAFTARTTAGGSQDIAIDALRVSTTPAATIVTGGPVITEFVAENGGSYEDENLDRSDWLEIFNGGTTAVAMGGWHLTDDPLVPNKWTFPAFTMAASGYRVVFASSKNRVAAAGTLHTNFSLSKTSGYLALVRPDLTIASEYVYGPQSTDISYGEVGASRTRGYLETPTPLKKNLTLIADAPPAESPQFSHPGGLITGTQAVPVSIAAPVSPNAVIRYSLTQAIPTTLSPAYTGPFNITATTTIRARIFEPGKLPSPVVSRTFLKLDTTLTNFNGTGQIFSSNLPVIIFDSAGVAVDSTTDPAAARPYRPTYAVTLAPDPVTGRARLDGAIDFQGRSATHVRGESSSGFAQKSYAWEIWNEKDLDRDQAILGLPAESDWVLHGPYSDKTMMRNHLVYSSFQDAREDWFSPRTKFVEVFFNQEANQPVSYADYRGVYLLVEKIKRSNNRVATADINSLVTAQPMVRGGYIFKKDKTSLGTTGWTTSTGVGMQGSTPEVLTSPQLSYLQGYVNSFESALNGGSYTNPTTGYAAWIDTDTFIDWQLAVEVSKQVDGYVFSTYFHKDRGGKMRAGPLWDFNISLGNADYAEGEFPTGWDYDTTRTAPLAGQLWFPRLLTDPNYRIATFDRYWELRRTIWSDAAFMARIDAVSELLRDGNSTTVTNATPLTATSPIARHFRKYAILGGRQWPNPASATTRTTYQAEVAELKSWIQTRLAWIDNQYSILSTPGRPPVLTRTEPGNGNALVTLAPFAGVEPGINFPRGTVYYTTDGRDPRPAGYAMPTSSNITVLAEYGQGSWLVPTAANGGQSLTLSSWTGLADPPNLASWSSGQLGIGFDTLASSSTNPFKYYMSGAHLNDNTWTGGAGNLESSMLNVSSSAFVRVPFTLTADQLARLVRLQLKMRYDDGFIAYVNGVEAIRQNVLPATAATWSAVADAVPANFTDTLGATGVTLDISHVIQNLQAGPNVLSILALNRSVTDNDFLCSPSLLGALGVKPGSAPAVTSTAYTGPLETALSNTIKARTFVPETGQWSALTTSNLLPQNQPASKENLVVSEIHYLPLPPTTAELAGGFFEASDFEFIEFLNTGTATVDLENVRLSGAVGEFNFSKAPLSARSIPPGGRVVLCANKSAYAVRYGNDTGAKIAGEFSGNLGNTGELIHLVDKNGAVIWSFNYSSLPPWPQLDDGYGSALVLNNPTTHPAPDPAIGTNWRASPARSGAPNQADSIAYTGPATPGADTDGDGMGDLLEYMFGSNPASASSIIAPNPVWNPGLPGSPGFPQLDIPRSSTAEGFQWKIEGSRDLQTWQPVGQTLLGSHRDPAGRLWEHWQVAPPTAGSGTSLFYRVSAQRN